MTSFHHFTLLITQQLKARMEYTGDFIIQLLALLLQQGAWLAFVWTLFLHVPDIQGWGFWEIAFLYGLVTIPGGLTALFFEGAWRLPGLIRQGDLDRLLIRPIDPVLHVYSLGLGMHGLSSVVLGLWIVVHSSFYLAHRLPWWTWLYLPMVVVSGTVIYAAVTLITNSLSFWADDTGTSIPFMVNRLAEYARFPLSLYPRFIANMLIWVLPFAFVGFFPVSFLLGHGFLWLGLASPLVAVLAFLVARAVFMAGLRRYESTGT